MVLVPMKDARQRGFTKHSRGCPCTYRVQSERISRFIEPSMDTPSVVAKQSFDRESKEYSLPKYLQIIYKQVMPHSILSC